MTEKTYAEFLLEKQRKVTHSGETVLSPFGGIGSEGYQSLRMGRKSISIELKPSYFEINKRNHRAAVEQNGQLSWI